ncbi:MAG: hypothetical protein CM15mV3_2900 [Caudoviricetes sp.]|nr:MAG: hypothetical protein CM15mV3_2900 [Caudoviricetes sp.]
MVHSKNLRTSSRHSNASPNYDKNDIFILPNLNNCAMVDIEASRISPEDAAVVGAYITENGNDAAPLSLITSYVDVNFAVKVILSYLER